MIKIVIVFFIISLFFTPGAFPKNHSSSIVQAVDNISSSQCYFIPPENWDIADPKTLSPSVKIAFLKKSPKGFCPSINLAIEETDVSLNDYLKAVKAIHEQDRNNQWRSLGKVRTAAGLGQLTEIDAKTEWGPVRILQLILIKEKQAYVLTAAALKEEMSNHYQEIQSAFRSFTISNDLFENIPQLDRRETLKQNQNTLLTDAEEYLQSSQNDLFEDQTFQEKHWLVFQKSVLDNFKDMGAFWQILILRNTREKLHRAQEDFVNFDSARQGQIEAQRPERGSHSKTMADEAAETRESPVDFRSAEQVNEVNRADRFGKVAASQNSQSLTERGALSLLIPEPSTEENYE